MRKSIKIIGTIVIIGIMLVCAYLLGTTQAETITEVQMITEVKEVIPDGYIDTNSEEFIDNYVDMRQVTCFEVEDGLQLYFEDGTGYYLE